MDIKKSIRTVDEGIQHIVEIISSKPLLLRITIIILLTLAVFIAVLIRVAPYKLNKLEFFEFDSYIEYWQAEYVYKNGPLSWYTLTRENPDTHIFWYPWGRDFIYTSYPFLPIWIGTTYHIAKNTGLSLAEWAAIQPVIFAITATITAYFAAKEVFESRVAGLIASYLFSALPSAIERSVIGYVEKEGIAATFVFLFIYFYAKGLKYIRLGKNGWLKHIVLSSIFLSLIGWLWGGYIFVLGTVVLFSVLSPIILGKSLLKNLIIANMLLIVFSMIFEIPSPSNARTLGIYPFSLNEVGWALLVASVIPLIYYYTAFEYRKLGLKKPLFTTSRYVLMLFILIIGGVVLSTTGLLPIGGRWAWALGLRFVQVDPLVESIAEHQSPLYSTATAIRMLRSWGVFFEPLIFASPLFLSIIGTMYLIYKGHAEKAYVALAFAAAFYSYLNAVYMIGIASYFGVIVAATMATGILNYAFPYLEVRTVEKKKAPRARVKRVSSTVRLAMLLLFIAVVVNTAYTGYAEYTLNSNVVYTLRAGVSDIQLYSDSWYKVIEAIKSTPEDAVVIAWWDYGYGISVAGGRASVADGSTINITQIGIVGLILLSNSTEQAANLAKLFNVKSNKTFLMIIEGLFVSEQNDTVIMWPLILGRGMPGLVDWPKSLWMIRIGNYVADNLRNYGINVSSISTENFLYIYNIGGGMISPRLDKPDEIPLIYRLVIDASLYWAENKGKQGQFYWYTGTEQTLDYYTIQNIREQLKINISKQIQPTDVVSITDRPLKNDIILKPYAIIMEPFRNPRTGEPVTVTFMNYSGELYSLILLYEFTHIP
ncbi:MAG: STT3 domain-containing protein [Desulfurococcaceae archaeon]